MTDASTKGMLSDEDCSWANEAKAVLKSNVVKSKAFEQKEVEPTMRNSQHNEKLNGMASLDATIFERTMWVDFNVFPNALLLQ
jgi:hypothetical protein